MISSIKFKLLRISYCTKKAQMDTLSLPLIWMHYKEPEPSQCFYATGTAGMILFLFYIPALIWLTCQNQQLVGVFDATGQLLDPIQIEQSCNSACNCASDVFVPVCDQSNTFVSPCHAGCTTAEINGNFTDCFCAENLNAIMTPGRCPTDD